MKRMGDELFEHKTKTTLTREEAAQRLRDLADAIARHNEVSFVANNKTVRIDVPPAGQAQGRVRARREGIRDRDRDLLVAPPLPTADARSDSVQSSVMPLADRLDDASTHTAPPNA